MNDYQHIFNFIDGVVKNNNREWFNSNKASYLKARDTFIELTAYLIKGIGHFDKNIEQLIAKKCVFRFYRDLRFTKDKRPYKENFGASIKKAGRKSPYAGYYIHLAPNNSYIGGGCFRPNRTVLSGIREEIDYNSEGFKAILNEKKFKKIFGDMKGEKLSRHPKGYSKDNPNIELLKHKSFIAMQEISDEYLENPEKIIESFEALSPFLEFLNKNIK